MTLLFNIRKIHNNLDAKLDDIQTIETVGKLVNELYRTLGILLYTRYISFQSEKLVPIHQDVASLISDHFHRPTLEYWHELVKMCTRHLHENGDRLVKDFDAHIQSQIDTEIVTIAKQVSKKLKSIIGGSRYNIPDDVKFPHLLRLVLNVGFDCLDGRMKGLENQLIEIRVPHLCKWVVRFLFGQFDFKVVIPVEIAKEGVSVIVLRGEETIQHDYPSYSEYVREPGTCYVSFYNDEDPFKFICRLFQFDNASKTCYVYLNFGNTEARFIGVLDEEEIELHQPYGSVDEVFETPIHLSMIPLVTQEQKFGEVDEFNGVTHNLSDPPSGYIERPKVEDMLLEEMSQPKFYITTLDGGGGFGKTWLAKSVVWDILSRNPYTLPVELCFSHVVWISGKQVHLRDYELVYEKPAFRSMEDIIDSILYITGNHLAIGRSMEKKKRNVIEALNECKGVLLVLDNLETLPDNKEIWAFLPELINAVSKNIRILVTSRTRFGTRESVVTVPPMEYQEAEKLAMQEMANLPDELRTDEIVKGIINATAGIPLLITNFIILLGDKRNFEDIKNGLNLIGDVKKKWSNALEFMCGMQWSELGPKAQRLFTGIAFLGGRITFTQARLLCRLSNAELDEAVDTLKLRSFLVVDSLLDSILEVPAPMFGFAKQRLDEDASFKDLFNDRKRFLASPKGEERTPVEEFDDEAALSRMFQQAEIEAQKGNVEVAYNWHEEATSRFSESAFAWRSRGVFEFRFLERDDAARRSFDNAIKLEPDNPDNYSAWAFWEFNRGLVKGDEFYYKQAISLNERALGHTRILEDKKRLIDFIAKSHMKIGYLIINKLRTAWKKDARKLIREKNAHFKRAILLLENNLYDEPEIGSEVYHNIIDFRLQTEAFLSIGSMMGSEREVFDNCAVFYLEKLLELDSQSTHTRRLLRHPGIINSLKRIGAQNSDLKYDSKVAAFMLSLGNKMSNARELAEPYLGKIR
jgi:tetratricopeptide (TPR) repeat protein